VTTNSPSCLRPATSVQVDLEHLARLVAMVLIEHADNDGFCAACPGVAFPCELAVVAEHNIALL
jgi:hypothetical protein